MRFAGGAAQDLSVQNGTEEIFHNIVLDKDFQTVLSLSDDLATTATGSVTLTGGIIETGASVLSVRNTTTGSISGFQPFSLVTPGVYANDGYINGRIERQIAGAGSYDFPIGVGAGGNGYNRLVLDVASGSGTVAASYNPGSPGGISVSTTTACPTVFDVEYTAMNDGYWSVEQSSGGTISYDVTVYPNDAAGITAPNPDDQYRVLKAPSGTADWSPFALDGDPCVVSGSFFEVTGAGYSGFSDFGIGGGGTPLPITLVDLDAQPIDGYVAVNWSTANEVNSDHFVVQRSADGLDWEAIGQVAAAGYSTQLRTYSFIDELPLNGYSYYRLRQVDLDESAELSHAVVVQRAFAGGDIRIWPNPTSGLVEVGGTEDLRSIEVMDLAGRSVQQAMTPRVDLSSLPAGLYSVRIQDARGVRVLRLLKQ